MRFSVVYSLMVGLTTFSISLYAAANYSCLKETLAQADQRIDPHAVRFATFNVAMNRQHAGELIKDLQVPNDQITTDNSADLQIAAIAEIIQRVQPDVVLLNEFDYDSRGQALALFQKNFLAVSQKGYNPIYFQYTYSAPVNTGVPSGKDFDNDGSNSGPGDAYGFGAFPGQYGMVLLSKYPIEQHFARTFQTFLWKNMPGALLPDNHETATAADYYSPDELAVFRLSSKSHWDIPLVIQGQRVHVLAAHPTPPVFDGVEDRNGRRNHDEIRFWADYVSGFPRSHYIEDDKGRRGGLDANAAFVILGDYNADPQDGDSKDYAIKQLLTHPDINAAITPASLGGLSDAQTEGSLNDLHAANPIFDTGDFNPKGPGNLRVDYVLPSKRWLAPLCGGIFWPQPHEESYRLTGEGYPVISSDHRLVWMDLKVKNHWWGH